jgi:sigma-E factor negative regulatory protein RseC
MVKQKALVTRVMSGQVEVEVAVETSCSGCGSADNCGVGTVSKAFSGKTQLLEINTQRILSVGQWVTIATQENNLLALAALTYLLPLLGLLLAGLVAQQLLDSEGAAILVSLAGAYLFHLIAKWLIKLREAKLPTISIV